MEEQNKLRHSCAHLLAAAVLEIWPDTKPTIGPAIENGFYYDFDFKEPISEREFVRIEQKMRELVKKWDKTEKIDVTYEEAKEKFKNNEYKLELIEEFHRDGKDLTFYKSGDFIDLCKGGHIENPKEQLKNFKLLSLAGAYWRGSEKNKMLTRMYGTAFATKEELEAHLVMLEEAKKRDHKKLGRELELFFFEETSPGMPYWLPNGLILYNLLYGFAREMYKKHNYLEVATPQLNKKELYETSGHWSLYKTDMFVSDMGENEVFGIKPMNCPNAMKIFGMTNRSYKNLPLRFADTSLLHRFELSGTLNGLFRTRQFRQDDAHIFLSTSQIQEEFENIMKMIREMYDPFELSYRLRFGTRPEKFLGESSDWDIAEESLKKVLVGSGKEYFEAPGEGAFYGPKVDILMKDSIGREWQTGTIQLDFQQPKRFELKYTDSDGQEKPPVVFHRAIYGSFERFLGILVEHFVGAFPVWLAPVQVEILPVSEKHNELAQKLSEKMKREGIRVLVNDENKTLGNKIRESSLKKIHFMVIIGDKEVASATNEDEMILSIRERGTKDNTEITLKNLIDTIKEKVNTRSLH